MGSIYKITNTVNGKAYIGQTIHDAVKKRINLHLNGHSRGSQLVKQAIEKYGRDAFTYEILHDGIIPEFLDPLEKEAIAKFNTVVPHGYNLTTGGGGGSTHSEATRRKISKAITGKGKSPEHCAKLSKAKKGENNPFYGKTHSPETLRKMSEAMRNSPKAKAQRERLRQQPVSAETRKKRSIALSGEKNPMYGKPGAMKGRKHSTETKRRMSEAKKGENHPNFGKNRSAETKRRIGEGNKGKTISQSTREKISRSLTGKYRNPHREEAEAFYFSLPVHLSSIEKRKIFREKFLNVVPDRTIYKWLKEWQSEP